MLSLNSHSLFQNSKVAVTGIDLPGRYLGMLIMAVRVVMVMVRQEVDIDLTPFRTPMLSRLPAGSALPAHNLPNFSKIPPDHSRCLQIENLGS